MVQVPRIWGVMRVQGEYSGTHQSVVLSFSKLTLELAFTVAIGRSDNKQNRCGIGEDCECEELCLFAISVQGNVICKL